MKVELKEFIDRGEIIKEPVIEKCLTCTKTIIVKKQPQVLTKGPCKRIDDKNECAAYIKPSVKWKNGNCSLATHLIYEEDEQKFKNPLKASKRAGR